MAADMTALREVMRWYYAMQARLQTNARQAAMTVERIEEVQAILRDPGLYPSRAIRYGVETHGRGQVSNPTAVAAQIHHERVRGAEAELTRLLCRLDELQSDSADIRFSTAAVEACLAAMDAELAEDLACRFGRRWGLYQLAIRRGITISSMEERLNRGLQDIGEYLQAHKMGISLPQGSRKTSVKTPEKCRNAGGNFVLSL